MNWNSAEFVGRCLDSIRQHITGFTYEIVVIDNASFDGCEQMLLERDPHVRFIQSGWNLGFAQGNNLVYWASHGTNLLFLSPDSEVVGPAIPCLYHELSRLPAAGVVGAKLLSRDGTVQTSCVQSFPTISNQVLDADWLRRRWPKAALLGMAALFQATAWAVEVGRFRVPT